MKKTTPTAQIALDFQKFDAPGLINFGSGIAAGLSNDPDITNPPVNSNTLYAEIGTVNPQTGLAGSLAKRAQGDRSETLTKLIAQQANTLIEDLTEDAAHVKARANKIANGDLAHAEQIITRIGYHLKKKGDKHPRSFEVVESGTGWVHLRAKRTKKTGSEGQAWQYGITTAKDTPPPTLKKPRFTLEVDVIIHDLPSGSIV
ncbi:MAG: hypothetical protein HY063_10640 [Bacteroidetes bacterium]|nr:hypothetical protein [Bacteroidota bacterium]